MSDTYDADMGEPEGGFDDEFDASQAVPEKDDDQRQDDAPPEREPLPPEEIERRYRQNATALRRAREDRRSAQRERDELRQKLDQLEQQRRAPARQEHDDDTPINPQEDPIGALEQAQRWRQQEVQQRQQRERTEAEQRQETQRIQALESRMAEAEDDFRIQRPDYDNAAEHYKAARLADFAAAGYTADGARRALAGELVQALQTALQRGKDPAAVVYALAQSRGFGNTRKVDAATERMQTFQRGIPASRSPSQGAARSSGSLTAASVAQIKDGAEFDKAFDKLHEQLKRRA